MNMRPPGWGQESNFNYKEQIYHDDESHGEWHTPSNNEKLQNSPSLKEQVAEIFYTLEDRLPEFKWYIALFSLGIVLFAINTAILFWQITLPPLFVVFPWAGTYACSFISIPFFKKSGRFRSFLGCTVFMIIGLTLSSYALTYPPTPSNFGSVLVIAITFIVATVYLLIGLLLR